MWQKPQLLADGIGGFVAFFGALKRQLIFKSIFGRSQYTKWRIGRGLRKHQFDRRETHRCRKRKKSSRSTGRGATVTTLRAA